MNTYFIRHGFSCANIHHLKENTDVINPKYYLDPVLTNTGVKDSINMSKVTKNLKYDIVCCSTLNRAIETALHMFPKDKIYVIPYVKETGKTRDSTSENLEDKIEHLKTLYPDDIKRIDFSYITKDNINSYNWSTFKKFFEKHLKDKNSCIVTHSRYMIRNLNVAEQPFPNNNCIYKYNFETMKSKKIHNGVRYAKQRPIDVSRCLKKQTIVLM